MGLRPPRWIEHTPPGIGPWMIGAESTDSSRTIAIRFFTFAVVSFSNRSAPVRLNVTCTYGRLPSPGELSNATRASVMYSPVMPAFLSNRYVR